MPDKQATYAPWNLYFDRVDRLIGGAIAQIMQKQYSQALECFEFAYNMLPFDEYPHIDKEYKQNEKKAQQYLTRSNNPKNKQELSQCLKKCTTN